MSGELNRTLGFWSCLAVGVGLVVASTTLVSLGQGMGLAGKGFIIAMICAWLLQLSSAVSFAELACMMPKAGGISAYTMPAMGALPGIVATICGYVVVNVLVGPAELFVAGTVVTTTFMPAVSPMLVAMVLLSAMVVLNILGVDIFAKFQIAFTAIMILTMTGLGLIGLLGLGQPAPAIPPMPFNPMGNEVFSLIALAIWLYIGIEFVCPMAEETVNPEKNIPWAMVAGLIIIFLVNILFGYASLLYIPLDKLAESAQPHVDVAAAMLGRPGEIAVAILSLSATASTVNTLIGVIPRMLYGMAHSGEMPKVLALVHPKFRTPWVGILLMGGSMGVVLLTGIAGIENIVIFIMAAACSWLLAYIIAHIDVIILRMKYKDVARPYKSPLFPLPQIAGSLGMIYCMLNIFPDPVAKEEIYKFAGLFIGGAILYAAVWVKFVMKRGLFQTESIEQVLAE